jgi:hexulose-6-phosphate isomerase
VGLDTIEWIYDAYGEDCNPIATEEGRQEMRRLSDTHGVTVESVVGDWFMNFPILRATTDESDFRWKRLAWLIQQCAHHGTIKRIVLPFVDAASMRSESDLDAVAAGINALGSMIDATNVELCLETSLAPLDFVALLAKIPHAGVKVNYDSGNSASRGYSPRAEIAAYGVRLRSVHLKDRRLGTSSVPLGTGDTDFEALFEALGALRFKGDFILEAARGVAGDEIEWTRNNVRIARSWLQQLDRAA